MRYPGTTGHPTHPARLPWILSCPTHRRAVVSSLTMDRHASSDHPSWRFTPSATTYTTDTRRLTTPRRRLLTVGSAMVAGKRLAYTRSPLTARYGRRDCPSTVHLHTPGLWSSHNAANTCQVISGESHPTLAFAEKVFLASRRGCNIIFNFVLFFANKLLT